MTVEAQSPPAIELVHVTKEFGSTTAVRDLSLSVSRGAIVSEPKWFRTANVLSASCISLSLSTPGADSNSLYGTESKASISIRSPAAAAFTARTAV